MAHQPTFYQTECQSCGERIAVHDQAKSFDCPGCGAHHHVPPKLGKEPAYTRIDWHLLEFDEQTLGGLEELTRELEELDQSFTIEREDQQYPVDIDTLVSVSRVLTSLRERTGLTPGELSAALSLVPWETSRTPPVPLPGVGPERHQLMTVDSTTYLLVIGNQPAVLFAGSFSAAKGLDIILEVFELFIMVAFGVKPGLKAIGKAFQKLVDKVANSRVYKRLVARLVEAIESRQVTKILDRLKDFIDRIFQDNYDELVEGLTDALKAYFKLVELLLTLILWLFRAITGGSSVGLEIAAWAIGFVIKLKTTE